ncbi:hypothetical protein FEV16_02050 [Methylocystis sp. B8]|nr:hypothetical protein FEV16_02050 [Methylocystis sp. B8]
MEALLTRRHYLLVTALGAAIVLYGATAQAQRRTPSGSAVSPTEHFGDKAPPKEEAAPPSKKPISGEEEARPGVGEVSKEPPVPTKARSIRLDPKAQPTPKP